MTPLFPSLTDVWFAQLIQRLGWTLLHSLWQGAAVAAILALTLALLRHRSAQSRYLAGCLGLAMLVGLTAATYCLQPPLRKPSIAARSGGKTATSEALSVQAPDAPLPPSIAPPPVVLPTQQSIRPHTYTQSADSLSTRLERWSTIYIEPMLPWLVGFWLAGVAVLALWQLAGWLYLRRLRRLAVPLDDPSLLQRVACLANDLQVHQTVRVFESALVGVPAVIGWLRPMIFLPLGLIGEMSPRQIDAILAHELAHIRRYDYLVNLLQCLAETLFFYHPAAWWISARIRAERENCCDDLALSLGYEPVNYAQSLLQLATLAAARCSSVRPIAGLSATGKPTQLHRRIARLLKVSEPPQRFARTWLMAYVLLVGLAILGVVSYGNARNGNSSQNAAESQMLHPLVQDMLASPVGSTQREVFFGALRRLAQEQGKDPLDYLTAHNRMFKAGFIDGRAVELDGQDKRYVLVILSTPPSVSPGVAGQQLVLLNRDGTILDRLQCYIASKYMREVQTNVPVDSQRDGANVVVHLGPRPAGLPADSDLSKPPAWHVIVLGQDVHEFEGGIGQDRDEEQGLCRIAVALNRFVVLFPSLAQGSWGTPDKGVALRLRSAKMQWPAEGKPTVLADFRNENQVGVLTSDVRGDWELEVDDQWYTWTGRTRQHRLSLKPGEVGGTMELPLGPGSWYAKHPALELSPGRHTLRLALNLVDAAQHTDAVGGTAPESKILSRRVVSGPLVLEVLPPVTTQSTEPTGVQSVGPGIDLKQRQRMLLEAMAANPPDRDNIRTALTDIGHVSLGFVQGPFDQEPTGKNLPAGASVQRWEKKYFLHYSDALNRLEGGPPPDQWIDRLIEIRQRGFELKFATLVAALTAQARAERDRLLTEADARIRRGLLELSEQFKTLRNTSNGPLADTLRHTREGQVGLFAQKVQGRKGGSPGPVAETDRYFVLVVIEPLHFPADGDSVTQMVKMPLPEYDQLALMGQVHYSAGDPKLDAAMKKLIGEALAPLKELNRRLSNREPVVLEVLPPATTQPATAWGKVVNGIQAGLRFGAQDRAYRSGELVEFVLVVRNTGDKTVVLADYLPLIGWPVTVRTIEGKIIPVNIPPFDGPVQGRKSIVEPGDSLEVGTVFLRIGQDGQMPSASLSPGAYLISLTYRFDDRTESTWHGELSTGDLTLNVARSKLPADILPLLLEVRSDALDANIAMLTTPEELPALAAILRDAEAPQYARKVAANILGRIGSPAARKALVEVLSKTQPPAYDDGRSLWSRLVDAVANCLERESDQELADDLKHDCPEVRWLAAVNLGKRKVASAAPSLIQMLDDQHPDPRVGATWALGEIQDPKGSAELIAIVESRRTGGSRVAAMEALGKIGTPRCIQALRSIKPDDSEYWKATKTLDALSNQPTTQPAVSWAENAPGMNFDDRNLKGVFLTEYEKASPRAVPKKQWKDFVTALGTARTRSGEVLPLEIRQDQGVLLELTGGAQIYLTGEGRYWRWEEGTNPPPPGHFLVCPALGQAVMAARAAVAAGGSEPAANTQPVRATQAATRPAGRAGAVAISDFVCACEIIDQGPLGHGRNGPSVSYKVKAQRIGPGGALTDTTEMWMHYSAGEFPEAVRHGGEAGHRKGDRFVGFVVRNQMRGQDWAFRLVRTESVESLEDIKESLAATRQAVQWENGSWSNDQPLQTRLGVQGKTFAAGGPIPMRLEVRNVGTQPVQYYHATGYEYGQIQVTGPDGQPLPFLVGPVSSESSGKNLPAGTEQLVDQFNLTDHYHMRKPGQYTVHFRGFGTGHKWEVSFLTFLPPSPTVQVTVTADPQSEADGDPVGKLLAGLPEGWSVWGSSKLDVNPVHPGQGWSQVPGCFKQIYHHSYSPKGPRGQPVGPTPITLWLTTEQAKVEPWTDNQLDADHPQRALTRYLGGNRFYHVYAYVPDSSLKLWPAVETDLRLILAMSLPAATTLPASQPAQTSWPADTRYWAVQIEDGTVVIDLEDGSEAVIRPRVEALKQYGVTDRDAFTYDLARKLRLRGYGYQGKGAIGRDNPGETAIGLRRELVVRLMDIATIQTRKKQPSTRGIPATQPGGKTAAP